ncbi:ABC transporter ATP-binding protein [Pararhizobium sp. IMCC21322]|uniref:ABC transporter ATP-binding protein n=1 Tax=Pararhizobium sp. IMCC21322 TaxID=3067903 RepID=UPI0027409890|nr:ABC transporter ATP-binding protein [Pararhizobium sp. IMCC21322]
MSNVEHPAVSQQKADNLLDVEDLTVAFKGGTDDVRVVRGADLAIRPSEVVGLVGESGSGKSILARAILGILPPTAAIISGRVTFANQDLQALSPRELRRLRGNRIAFVPQEPMTSLNPGIRIGRQLTEVLDVHRPDLGRKEKVDFATEMLDLVGIRYARERLAQYPHQLSGGLRQRVAIAMALICQRVELLIADEPTTALDVTIQAQILDLFVKLQKKQKMSMLLITHDLGVVAQTAHRVAVMYAGEIVEVAPVVDLFEEPLHPYTKGLLASLPEIGNAPRKSDFPSIEGSVPSPFDVRRGCAFAARCAFGDNDQCQTVQPLLEQASAGRSVRCHRWSELAGQVKQQVLVP